MNKREKKNFNCDICGKTFTSKNFVRIILKQFTIRKEDMLCKVSKEHVETVHDGIRKFKCDSCEKQFTKSSDLNAHVVTVHQKKEDFKCTKCSKTYGVKSKLKMHSRNTNAITAKKNLPTNVTYKIISLLYMAKVRNLNV